MSSKVAKRLVHLYKQMADLTAPECAKTCSVPWGCCNPIYCEQAIDWAKLHWGVELKRVNGVGVHGQVLPLLGPNGCTCAPHLRPICTVHTCEISSIGHKRGDWTWTKRYFQIRDELDEIEMTGLDDIVSMLPERKTCQK